MESNCIFPRLAGLNFPGCKLHYIQGIRFQYQITSNFYGFSSKSPTLPLSGLKAFRRKISVPAGDRPAKIQKISSCSGLTKFWRRRREIGGGSNAWRKPDKPETGVRRMDLFYAWFFSDIAMMDWLQTSGGYRFGRGAIFRVPPIPCYQEDIAWEM